MKADKVWQHAKVYSAAADGAETEAEAIAVKDGKIIFVGSSKDSEKYIDAENTFVTDCKGACIIPSFVDSHVHLARSAAGFFTKEKSCMIYKTAGFGTVSGIEKRGHSFRDLLELRKKSIPGERIVGACMIRRDSAEEDLKKAVSERKEIAGDDCLILNTVTYLLDNDDFAMCEPYTLQYCEEHGKPAGYNGTLLWEEDKLKKSVKDAASQGFHIRITAHGDRAVKSAVDAILYAKKECRNDAVRFSVSHCAYVREEDRERMAENGITAVIHPGKFGLIGTRAATKKENVGNTGAGAYPFGSLVSAGVRCALGFMFDETNSLNPFSEMYEARRKRKGEEVDVRSLIRAGTINGAMLFGLEDVTGSIEVGKSADFLMLKKDIFGKWRTNRVIESVFQGKVVWSDKKEEDIYYDDAVKLYRSEIRKYPKLSREQEQELAEEIVKGSHEAVNRLVNASLYLALREAEKKKNKCVYCNMEFMDMINTANVGLLRAAQKFKPDRGAAFSTFAMYYINDEIDKVITNAEKGDMKDTEKIRKLYKAENEYIKKYGTEPSEPELADLMGITESELGLIRSEMYGATPSIDMELDDEEGGGLRLVDTLTAPEPDLAERFEKMSRSELVDKLLVHLTEDERTAIKFVYGIEGEAGNLSYKDIAQKMGKTAREVMGLVDTAKRRLAEAAKTEFSPEDYM